MLDFTVGKRYVLRQDQPTCLPCYEEKFANKCEKCEKPIGTDFKVGAVTGGGSTL